jgi:hypothetical protein
MPAGRAGREGVRCRDPLGRVESAVRRQCPAREPMLLLRDFGLQATNTLLLSRSRERSAAPVKSRKACQRMAGFHEPLDFLMRPWFRSHFWGLSVGGGLDAVQFRVLVALGH